MQKLSSPMWVHLRQLEDQVHWRGPPCHIGQRLKDSPRQNNFSQAAHSLEHCWRPRRSLIWPGNLPPSHHLLHKRYFDNNWSKGHLGPLALLFWNIVVNSVKSVAANVYDSRQHWDVWLSAAGLVQDLWVDNLQGAPVWTRIMKYAGLEEGTGPHQYLSNHFHQQILTWNRCHFKLGSEAKVGRQVSQETEGEPGDQA